MAVNQKPFFGRKGGVTFSGGEPTSQAQGLIPLVDKLHEEGIHICIDTNGGVWNSHIEELMSKVDLVLLDVKQMNPARHESLTGRSNARTLETAKWLEGNNKPFWLRYVLVPGISDFEEDIRALGEHFKSYKMLQRVEILPYHTLGTHKYETMGVEYQLKDTKHNTPEQLDKAKTLFNEYFDCVILN
jgi:pyruvate formate lyase activating enzyme